VTTGKAGDWASFWNLDAERLATLEKREIKRQNVIFEFIAAEEEYNADLSTMLNLWQKSLITHPHSTIPIIPGKRLDDFVAAVFRNVKPIMDWHSKKLLTPLRERQASQGPVVLGIGDVVLEWVRGCRDGYVDYAGGYPMADKFIREEKAANPLFASYLEVLSRKPSLRCSVLVLIHTLESRFARISSSNGGRGLCFTLWVLGGD